MPDSAKLDCRMRVFQHMRGLSQCLSVRALNTAQYITLLSSTPSMFLIQGFYLLLLEFMVPTISIKIQNNANQDLMQLPRRGASVDGERCVSGFTSI